MRSSLTRAQAHAMIRLTYEWQSAKQLEASILTLEGLKYRGLVERKFVDAKTKPEANFYRRINDPD